MDRTMSYYEMLEVPQHAPAEAIKKAYAKKLSEYTGERYAQEFELITVAYDTLSDADLRKEYDERLRQDPSYEAMKAREGYYFEERFEKAWISFKMGELEQAIELLRDYDDVLPGNEEVELLLCDCLLQLDMLEEAEEKITACMNKGKNEEAWLHLMLRLCFAKEDFATARPYGLKLVSLDPHNPYYVWKYAQTYTLEKDFFTASRIASDYFSSHALNMKSVELMILLLFSASFTGDARLYEVAKQKLTRYAARSSAEDREEIARYLKKEMAVMAPAHYFYVDLMNVISEISGGASREMETWLKEAREKRMKNVFYYPDNHEKVLKERKQQSASGGRAAPGMAGNSFAEEIGAFYPEDTGSAARRKGAGEGSVLWSILFGLFVAMFIDPLFGFVSGLIWFYRAEKIRQLWNGLGYALFVIFYIFLFILQFE